MDCARLARPGRAIRVRHAVLFGERAGRVDNIGCYTDKAIRVVSGASGAGGASGGTTPFSLVLASRTITQANLPSYTLPDTIAASTTTTLTNGTLVHRAGTATDLGGGSGAGYIDIARATITASSTTTITGSVTSGGSGTAMDFAVQYISVIKATRA
jgi:hypothetical protein